MKKKSFTLIEILVATTVFVIAMVIFLASLSLVMKPRAKSQSQNAVQETLKSAIDKISNDAFRIDTNYSDVAPNNKDYYGMGFTGENGAALSCGSNPCSGNRLSFNYNLNSVKMIESFGVYQKQAGDSDWHFRAGTCIPQPDYPCQLLMANLTDVEGAVPEYVNISNSDVDVTDFSVRGFFWSDANHYNANTVTPYAEVTITAKSHYTNVTEAAQPVTIKTLVNPIYKLPYGTY